MRKIKFRAWDTIEKCWKIFDIPSMFEAEKVFNYKYINFSNWQQFTGLKDKNGKDIYEGDIVKYRTHPMKTSKGIVVWSKNEPALKILDDHIYYSLGSINMIEIIGNIFENPEPINNPLT